MTVFEHLEELRSRLFKMLIAFVLASAVAWIAYNQILGLLVAPLSRLQGADTIVSNGKLIFTAPTEALFVRLKVTSFAGMILALPVIFWQLWRFVTPGLHRNERRYSLLFVTAAVALFVAGAAFALTSLPRALGLLTSFAGTELVLLPRAAEYLSFVMLMVWAFGLAFEFPLVLLALTFVGVLSSEKLRSGRRVAWMGLLLAAAILTPTQDPFTLVFLAIPLALLYEVVILIARLAKR